MTDVNAPRGEAGLHRWGTLRPWVWRSVLVASLLGFELFSLLQAYRPAAIADARGPFMAVNEFIKLVALSVFSMPGAIAFLVLTWRKLPALEGVWTESVGTRPWPLWLLANAAAFMVLLVLTRVLNVSDAASGSIWIAYVLWSLGVVAIVLLLAAAFAPMSFYAHAISHHWQAILLSIAAGVVVTQLAAYSQFLWEMMAGVTLRAVTSVLTLYEQDVSFSVSARTITVGDFSVFIARECSGYEGIGLVAGFTALFLLAFRRDLRFPNALLAIPAAIVASWVLNILRIAALVSIGAHVSRTLATDGFHSQAGWLAFLSISIGIMLIAYQSRFFRNQPTVAEADPGARMAIAYLAPFIAIMLGLIVAKAASVDGYSLYPLVVVLASAAMWPFRDVYRSLAMRPSWVGVVVGAAVGVGWVATDPGRSAQSPLGDWLSTLPPMLAAAWVVVRVLGATLFVPIAEELAFRGYLHRALISPRFETVRPGQFSLLAFAVTTLLFAAMHQRWLAAALAGAAYAIVMYRTNRVSDAIVAHMTSNAVIAAWAIAFGHWSLL